MIERLNIIEQRYNELNELLSSEEVLSNYTEMMKLNKEKASIEETVNKSKIDSIMETARRMYAKKDSSEWLALDRRYISKLMLEGVGYSNASKMLMQAKAGK